VLGSPWGNHGHLRMAVALLLPILFNPFWVTALVLFFGIRFMNRRRYWRTRGFRIALAVAAILFVVDLGFTLRRVHFAWTSPNQPVIENSIPLPRSLVAVGGCAGCHQLLRSRAIDELIVVDLPRNSPQGPIPMRAFRMRASWVEPGKCPSATLMRAGAWQNVINEGYCPTIEPVEIPQEGVFVVYESFLFTANQMAWWVKPHFLQHTPPGRIIQFQGIEVQERKAGKITVLAHQRYVTAPSVLLPMLGCWARPDNIFWIMPPGDTGCGLWRWFAQGGQRIGDTGWVFTKAIIHDKEQNPPLAPPAFPPPTPKDALAAFDTYFEQIPRYNLVQDALFSAENTDTEIVGAIVKRAHQRNIEGAVIARLYRERPGAIAELVAKMSITYEKPRYVTYSDMLVTLMENDRSFSDLFADKMFEAMPLWWPRTEILRYIALMEKNDPQFFCKRFERILGDNGIVAHAYRLKRVGGWPDFIPAVTVNAIRNCGADGLAFYEKIRQRVSADHRYLDYFDRYIAEAERKR
jgi:hypothetical protein